MSTIVERLRCLKLSCRGEDDSYDSNAKPFVLIRPNSINCSLSPTDKKTRMDQLFVGARTRRGGEGVVSGPVETGDRVDTSRRDLKVETGIATWL